jgi:NAD(P)-dependent dehydrogenase (short-subunit alcohol dehydrogenase family)
MAGPIFLKEQGMKALDGKAAIVTGGARGVAKGVATAFIKAGAHVLIVDREVDIGRATEAELRALGGRVHFLPVDLAERARLPRIIEAALSHFGKLDILVNAAQASRQLLLAETPDEAMDVSFDTGFWPTFVLMREAYPHLVKSKGSVINFATGAAFDAIATQGSYCAAKEAIRAISKVAASEWGGEGVRVNIICPFANSPGVMAWKEWAPDDYDTQIGKVSLKRIGDCEKDIGSAAVFLASDAAAYITGQTLMVDGGQTKAF